MEFSQPTSICPPKQKKYASVKHSKNLLSYRKIILASAGLKLIQNQTDLGLAQIRKH